MVDEHPHGAADARRLRRRQVGFALSFSLTVTFSIGERQPQFKSIPIFKWLGFKLTVVIRLGQRQSLTQSERQRLTVELAKFIRLGFGFKLIIGERIRIKLFECQPFDLGQRVASSRRGHA